jgi:hypothetical protein
MDGAKRTGSEHQPTEGKTGMKNERRKQSHRLSFVLIHDFMMVDLKLTGVPLLVYARIFGFWACGRVFYESKEGTAKFLNVSARAVFRAIGQLTENGLVYDLTPERSKTESGRYSITIESLPVRVQENMNLYRSTAYDMTSYEDASVDERPAYDDLSSGHMTICHPIRKVDNKHFDKKGDTDEA